MRRIEIYSLYERIWHWLQAFAILSLSVTGMEVHAPERIHLLGFQTASTLHEALALFTIANGFLALFTHLATGTIRQYLPAPRDVFTQGVLQARYYTIGIFHGEPHPFARGPEKKLNVLQQVTYLMILNLLLPTQVITGALLWEAARFPKFIETIGGLSAIATIHVAAAWLFIAFIVMHVYLTTTGHTPLAHLRSMITGYDEHPAETQEIAAKESPKEPRHESTES